LETDVIAELKLRSRIRFSLNYIKFERFWRLVKIGCWWWKSC